MTARRILFFILYMLPTLYLKGITCEARDHTIDEKEYVYPVPDRIREFPITENDTLTYTLKLALDVKGKPQYFFRNIFTPVCYTNECKPVYINFYWDLLGNYVRYDLPEGKILTKIDHEEFKQEDYQKLTDILAKPSSIFADLKMEDLMTKGTDSLSDQVDAKTGATLKTIKNEIIEGAVYTCFTLWHIAHGKLVSKKMTEITESYASHEMIHNFLASNNYHYQYWAMEKVINKNGGVEKEYEKDIENIITGKNPFTARTALQKLGTEFLEGSVKQNWLWKTYRSSSYALQIAILKKLDSMTLAPDIIDDLATSAIESNAEQFKMKLGILTKQKILPESVLILLAENLKAENDQYTSGIYKALEHFQPKNKQVKSKMEQYKKKHAN